MENARDLIRSLHKLLKTTFKRSESCLHPLYLDRDFVGQAVLRLAVAVLHFPALFVSFLRFSADAERCVP